MARKTQEITAVLHLPESEEALRRFEDTMCKFYTAQVEKRLQHLPKEQKLEFIGVLMENYRKSL
jgi:hypothetical protein